MAIEGEKVEKGKSLKLSVKNTIPSYVITWKKPVIVKDNEPIFRGTERGTFTITAVVDTGLEKKEISKEIQVLEKKLNTQSWEGSTGESFDLVLQDGEGPEYDFDKSMLSLNGTRFTALSAGETVIKVTDGGKEFRCNVTVKDPGAAIMSQAETISATMLETGFIYSNSGCSHSLDDALASDNSKGNCGIYVSWVLQEAGFLDRGRTVYFSHGLMGSGASEIENSDKLSVSYPGRDPEECELHPGDICCFQLNKSSGHIAIFAGAGDDGELLWYTGGKDATDTGKDGGVYENFGPRKQKYYNEVEVLIRPN